jgi:hypothetical protein
LDLDYVNNIKTKALEVLIDSMGKALSLVSDELNFVYFSDLSKLIKPELHKTTLPYGDPIYEMYIGQITVETPEQ